MLHLRQTLPLLLAASMALSCREEKKPAPPAAMAVQDTAAHWYKNSVIYTLDVEVFQDSDGDGTGDFRGLTQRLGYFDSLGVTALWIAPFQATANRDDGYDITDYYAVDPRLGTMADFKAFMQAARAHRLRIITDLVVNHTSDRHPWFEQARRDPRSPYRAWYVWSDSRPANYDKGMVFPGVQQSIWTYDSLAQAWYYHRFYEFQPDLNAQHPAVVAEVRRIMKFWIDLGLSGFRLDGVPFFIEVPQKKGEHFEHRYDMLADLRRYLTALRKDAIILGEANVAPGETLDFFGRQGEGMQMMFNFYVNQYLFYALATEDAQPLAKALTATKDIPSSAQWGQFLRNHDEADLGRLSRGEREEVYRRFGPDSTMQLYDRGIRRRLAPMLQGHPEQLKMAYSLLFSLPSTPVIRYGDEIGMGDDLRLPERMPVRTPMQWTPEKNAGFSTADTTVRPLIRQGRYGCPNVNVQAAAQDSLSLWHWTRQLIRMRLACPEIAFGSWELEPTANAGVLAIRYSWAGSTVLLLNNLSGKPQLAQPKSKGSRHLEDLVHYTRIEAEPEGSYRISLAPYGTGWYRERH